MGEILSNIKLYYPDNDTVCMTSAPIVLESDDTPSQSDTFQICDELSSTYIGYVYGDMDKMTALLSNLYERRINQEAQKILNHYAGEIDLKNAQMAFTTYNHVDYFLGVLSNGILYTNLYQKFKVINNKICMNCD